MLSSLLKRLGLSKKEHKPTAEELIKEMRESVNDFENRPIYIKLTTKIINNAKDSELLQMVFDNLSKKITDHKNEYQMVLTFSKAQQAIYTIWCLEAEVNNGGFNQYYFNSSRQFAPLTPDALQLVGAHQFAELADTANHIFVEEYTKITEHQDGTLEGFSKSYKDNPLNKLDEKFFALYKTEDLQQLQVDFIRRNTTDFIEE
jgi:hypothetical protein